MRDNYNILGNYTKPNPTENTALANIERKIRKKEKLKERKHIQYIVKTIKNILKMLGFSLVSISVVSNKFGELYEEDYEKKKTI